MQAPTNKKAEPFFMINIENYLPKTFKVKQHVLYRNEVHVAILNPSIQFISAPNDSSLQVIGPKGCVKLRRDADGYDCLAALFANGSLVMGDSHAVQKVQKYLLSEESSRTTAYLCSIVKCCEDIQQFYEVVQRSSVAIIGCGGIGSLASMLLAGAGIRKISLADPDIIEKSNFNRQFFWTKNSIGNNKASFLATCINERFPEVKISIFEKKMDEFLLDDLIPEVDGVIFSADEPLGIVRTGRRISHKYGKHFVSGGYYFDEAVVTSSVEFQNDDHYLFEQIPEKIAPSYGPTNVVVAGAVVNSLLLRMSGLIEDWPLHKSWSIHRWPFY